MMSIIIKHKLIFGCPGLAGKGLVSQAGHPFSKHTKLKVYIVCHTQSHKLLFYGRT